MAREHKLMMREALTGETSATGPGWRAEKWTPRSFRALIDGQADPACGRNEADERGEPAQHF